MTLAIRVHGVPEAVAAFEDLPRSVQNHGMRVAMNAGAGVIRDAMAARTPAATGLLKKSFRVKVKVPNASFNTAHHGKPAYAVIGPSRNIAGIQTFRKTGIRGSVKTVRLKRVGGKGGFDTFAKSGTRVATELNRPSRYWHVVDRGAKAHTITAKSARTLSNSDTAFGRSVSHPGFSGRRIAAQSVSSAGPAAQSKVIGKLKGHISEWAAKRAVSLAGA